MWRLGGPKCLGAHRTTPRIAPGDTAATELWPAPTSSVTRVFLPTDRPTERVQAVRIEDAATIPAS
jgi:hypothetical protein